MKKVLFVITVCVISGMIGLGVKQLYHSYQFQKLYQSLLKEKTSDVLFLGRPTCGFCNLLKPILDETSKKYNIEYRYINTDWLSKKELEKVLDKLRIRKSTFSTPRILITEGSRVVDSHIGYMDDVSLFYYLKRNRLIQETESFIDPYPHIKRLNSQDYFEILDQKKDAIVLIERIGDSKTEEVLKYANEKTLAIYFLSPTMLKDGSERKRFEEGIKALDEEVVLPMLLHINDGEITRVVKGDRIFMGNNG